MINKVRVKDIPNLLQDKDFWKRKVVPISRQKLYMLSLNPDAEADDIVLYYHTNDNKEVISSLVNFAAKLNDSNQTKFHFISSWWSNREKKGAGKELLAESYKEIDGKGISHNYTPDTYKVYEDMDVWNNLSTKNMYVIHFDFRDKQFPKKLNTVKRQVSFLKNRENSAIEKDILNTLTNVKVEVISEIDAESQEFLKPYWNENLVHRETDSLNWFRHNPWVINSPVMQLNQMAYYFFTAVEENYSLYYLKIFQCSQFCGFVVASVIRNKVKVNYLYAENHYYSTVANVLTLLAFNENCNQVVTNEEELQKHFIQKDYVSRITSQERSSLVGKGLDVENVKDKKLHLGDSDVLLF